jgi:hypothetical protein
MRLSHPDYIKLIVGLYAQRRQDLSLSSLLANPTPANIKQECLNVYAERTKRGDREEVNTLKAFFGVPPTGKTFRHLIENCNPDKFRPVQSLIKGRIKNPAVTNVELLAWLIDFRHRPWLLEKDVILNEEEITILGEQANDHVEPDPKPRAIVKHNRTKIVMAILLIIAIFFGGIYVIDREEANQMKLRSANIGCMYWTGTNYEEIPCNEERKDILKLPIDLEKMKSFKKIMREDTITEKSIGKVYYIRINGGIEYYTSGGKHPVDVTRNLQKLSRYMFDKHLRKDEITKKGL